MKTLSIDEGEESKDEGAAPIPWIVRIGSSGAPMDPPVLVPLEGKKRIGLGRSEGGRAGRADGESLRVETNDPWMSGDHAELERSPAGWELRDLGSSNGTLVWGQRRSTTLLVDGDVFETGGTFWVFRTMAAPEGLPSAPGTDELASLHPPFVSTGDRLRRVARTRVPVLLLGATGTGKEVLARELHRVSMRPGAFVAINTAAIQKTLIASELFGVEKGAHSTADETRPGQLRAADGGTLLLDEVGDMPLEVQAAILRVIQESEVLPVGSAKPIRVDVRFVCATHRDLGALVDDGSFRADLFGRIKGCVLEIPSLEDRIEDIGILIARILARYRGERMTFSTGAYRALLQYTWPLNVRELERALEAAIALAPKDRIEVEHLPREIARHRPQAGLDRAAPSTEDGGVTDAALEREIVRLMSLHHGNVSKVARSMGRSRMQLHRWLKKLALDPGDYRA